MRTLHGYSLMSLLAAGSLFTAGPDPAAAGTVPPGETAPHDSANATPNRLTGRVLSVNGSLVQLETRDKRTVQVDTAEAARNHLLVPFKPGSLITVYGAYAARGILLAQSVQRAKSGMVAWSADR